MAATGLFVVDCSVSIAWLFDEQADDYTEAALDLLRHLQRLPVRLQESRASLFELHALAIRHQLSSCDARYLDAALVTGLPLATRDKALQQAAVDSGVGVWSGLDQPAVLSRSISA